MSVLLIHPEDNPDSGSWRDLHCDRVIDLGLSGKNSYARWSRNFGCPVNGLTYLHRGMSEIRRVRDLLAAGRGRLVDSQGLDWWEILSICLTEQLEAVVLLQRLAETLAGDEVYISRPGFHEQVLQKLLRGRLKILSSGRNSRRSAGITHYLRAARKLSVSQIVDVLCDKYDPGYWLRSHIPHSRRASQVPVVLIPTAYVNVSRTGIAYAETLPQQNFLLVSTRRSGWMKDLPPNVASAWLSSYAVVRNRSAEAAEIESRWSALLKELIAIPELKLLHDLGVFARFPKELRHGLEVRDAWLNVFDREPVRSVLCADDSNPYTRTPLLLARQRGLPAVACHHGALDGYYALKQTYGDVILAKGKMERDYLVQCCRAPTEKVEIGAPARLSRSQHKQWNREVLRSQILFISEGYEVGNARAEEFYRDVLPPLADLALSRGRRLIVKLHPSESRSERTNMVKRVLSAQQLKVTQIVSGPLTDALLDETWFAVTVLSTVATECAMRGIPCFLCKWLEYSFYGYIDQFIRFGAGIGLNDPSEISKIPQRLEKYEADPGVSENLWQPVEAERLNDMLSLSPRVFSKVSA
jgi:hypothetical protein